MPGRKLAFTGRDKKLLLVFFTKPNNNNYLECLSLWKSTTEISKELNESSDKTKRKLKKLHGFGLLFAKSVLFDTRPPYHYWAINRGGLYYILSTLKRDKLAAFLKSNENNIKEFGDVLRLVQKNDEQVSFLTRRIKDMVKKQQYDLLENFIKNWRQKNVSMQYSLLRFCAPREEQIKDKVISQAGIKILEGFIE